MTPDVHFWSDGEFFWVWKVSDVNFLGRTLPSDKFGKQHLRIHLNTVVVMDPNLDESIDSVESKEDVICIENEIAAEKDEGQIKLRMFQTRRCLLPGLGKILG